MFVYAYSKRLLRSAFVVVLGLPILVGVRSFGAVDLREFYEDLGSQVLSNAARLLEGWLREPPENNQTKRTPAEAKQITQDGLDGCIASIRDIVGCISDMENDQSSRAQYQLFNALTCSNRSLISVVTANGDLMTGLLGRLRQNNFETARVTVDAISKVLLGIAIGMQLPGVLGVIVGGVQVINVARDITASAYDNWQLRKQFRITQGVVEVFRIVYLVGGETYMFTKYTVPQGQLRLFENEERRLFWEGLVARKVDIGGDSNSNEVKQGLAGYLGCRRQELTKAMVQLERFRKELD
ncbi:hypothetical protein ABW19_dt0202433 [Dactylella cylindrospora]|nr:hypothetical protein ABW19_dt0202433 [Dactylella cylindrospora]